VKVHRIASGGVAGKGPVARLRNLVRLGWGVLQSRRLLRRLDPAVVVGFGGYPSIPPLVAAQRDDVPTVLHEQNAVMGRANRFLAKRATRLALSFDQVQFSDRVAAERRTVTGNPVRPEISAIGDAPYAAPHAGEKVRLFVMGGSLGARVFGKAVPDAVALLHQDLRRRLAIAQQARAEDLQQVGEAYRALDLIVELKPFFEDVPERLRQAHLLVTRAGASTLAELTAAGRPAVLVPLPNSIDDHQMANARALDSIGGGWLLPESALSPAALAKILEAALTEPARLQQAATAAKSLGKRDAADRLADLVVDLLPLDARASLQRGTH
jgi:UDP-N-acetylglucosamine--N-acetylmuramyl-(pentapeptide) pyrophosphoryl-undecaprenol N-acetylglucosamine transferase